MPDESHKRYTMKGGPKGAPILGMLGAVKRDPAGVLMKNALTYGDIIPFDMIGRTVVQVNHPELVRYVLMENHKNYYKSKGYIRFQAALGQGLFTSNGEKWRRDRQNIQPMFRREQIEGYYFEVASAVAEKYKQRWLALTEKGPVTLDVTREMAAITLEVIVKLILGKDNLDDSAIASLHHSYDVFMRYLKKARLLPQVDMRKLFRMPSYYEFARELENVEARVKMLSEQYRRGALSDQYNMLALLLKAQTQSPEHFTDRDIRDHSVTMLFAGFETTSILLQWMWHTLDAKPMIGIKLREHITSVAPITAAANSSPLTYEAVARMDYLGMIIKETMRLYPPIWMNGREPMEDDYLGDYLVKKGTVVLVPQIVMHRHPRWWNDPLEFIPERFTPENEEKIDLGLYFPFSQGPRKCSGFKLAEMEARTIFAKLFPLFTVKALNTEGNGMDPGISLKLQQPLQVEIRRIN